MVASPLHYCRPQVQQAQEQVEQQQEELAARERSLRRREEGLEGAKVTLDMEGGEGRSCNCNGTCACANLSMVAALTHCDAPLCLQGACDQLDAREQRTRQQELELADAKQAAQVNLQAAEVMRRSLEAERADLQQLHERLQQQQAATAAEALRLADLQQVGRVGGWMDGSHAADCHAAGGSEPGA